MGLNAGLVPARVDGPAKLGLLDLVEHARGEGLSGRWACRQLGLDHARMLAWSAKANAGADLADASPGPVPGEALHALLDWERDAVVELAKRWGQIDLSHRKLAHRGSRLGRVFVAESTVLRVLTAAGMHLPGLPVVRERRGKTPWPDWVELVPGQIFIYDFTHFSGLRGWCAIAVVDVVSRYWLSTVLAPEETWVQVETAFIAALEADGKGWLLEDAAPGRATRQWPGARERRPGAGAAGRERQRSADALERRPRSSWRSPGSPSTSAAPAPRTTRPGSSRSSATSRPSTPT